MWDIFHYTAMYHNITKAQLEGWGCGHRWQLKQAVLHNPWGISAWFFMPRYPGGKIRKEGFQAFHTGKLLDHTRHWRVTLTFSKSMYSRTWHPAFSNILAYSTVLSVSAKTRTLAVIGTFRCLWHRLTENTSVKCNVNTNYLSAIIQWNRILG